MILEGKLVQLRPMTEADKPAFYEMATNSDATPYLYGELHGDPIPTREKLFSDYTDHYFDDSKPELGRCFAIMVGERMVGQVSYNDIDRIRNIVELDIWIAKNSDTGKGYGSDSLKTLMSYLFREMHVGHFFICPSPSNPRAVRGYQNAGFSIVETFIDRFGKEAMRMEVTWKK